MSGDLVAAARPVLLAGAFGQRNPGDEALLAAFRRALPDVELVAASTDPAHTAWSHGLRTVDARSAIAMARAVNDCRAVIFAGGTVFKALPPGTGRQPHALLRNAVAVATLARLRGRPLLLVGVGAGDLSNRACRPLARQLARTADLLVLRDAESARRLVDVGVPGPLRVGSDAAWTLLDLVPEAVPRSRPERIVVVLSRWTTTLDALPRLAGALQPLLDEGARVELQPWQIGGPGIDDGDLSTQLAAQLTGDVQVVAAPADLLAAVRSFQTARLVLAGRFHALIAAAAAGTTSLAVTANEPKYAALSSRLGQPSVPITADPARLAAAVRDALAAPPAPAAAVRAEVAAAEEAFGLLRLMLTDGEGPAEDISGLRLEPAA